MHSQVLSKLSIWSCHSGTAHFLLLRFAETLGEIGAFAKVHVAKLFKRVGNKKFILD